MNDISKIGNILLVIISLFCFLLFFVYALFNLTFLSVMGAILTGFFLCSSAYSNFIKGE